jgi:hypothetical protein
MRTMLSCALIVISTQIMSGQFLMTAGTTMNDTKSFEMMIGGWKNVADTTISLPRIGGYMSFGVGGEGDYEMMGAKYYSNITAAESSGWGDEVVGYQSAGGLFYFGAGLIFGIYKPTDASKMGHFIMVGAEGGNDGPIQQVRDDPSGILGGGTYAIDSTRKPTPYGAMRIQYFADFSNFLVGFGYVLGTHPGVTLHLGLDIVQ